jgi:hypothetical protein
MKSLFEEMLECRSINECIDLALVDAYGEEEQAVAWLTCMEEMFSRFEQVELMGRPVMLEGFDLAHGRAIVAICKEGKKSARVSIESVKFAGMTPIESRWLKAWKKFSKTV